MRARVCCLVGVLVAAGSSTAAAQSAPSATRPSPPYYELYPDHLPYQAGEPIPMGYVVEKNTSRTWGIVGGAVALGVFYTYGLVTVRGGSEGAAWLFLPVVGPPGLLITHADKCKSRCYGMDRTSIIIDAVGQAGGAALFIWGLSSWRLRLVREDLVHPQAFVMPMLVGSGYGVGAVGSF